MNKKYTALARLSIIIRYTGKLFKEQIISIQAHGYNKHSLMTTGLCKAIS
jgi:hypothetical protein